MSSNNDARTDVSFKKRPRAKETVKRKFKASTFPATEG
jgi:hypothetical protein